jgi:hypothetical protein
MGATDMSRLTVVTVVLEDTEDGGLRVHSENLPGLILSGDNRAKVASKIVPAIRALFEHHGIKDVRVIPARPISEVLEGKSPRNMHVHIHHELFVVELPTAA